MTKEKAIIKLRLLYKRLKEYKRSAFFGVRADSTEVINLLTEYNELRHAFTELDSDIFGDLKEVNPPRPEEASSFSHHDVGTLVFSPEHFGALENELEKAVEYATFIQSHKNEDTNQIKGNISITATEGSLVNLTVGDNNKVLQNTGQIDRILGELEVLGVEKSDLSTLKEVINQNARGEESKISTGKRILTWVGNLTKKMVEKGLTDNLPDIIEKAQSLTNLI
ncbi:hypothetical protein QWY31_03520 [Cytophagales bacterium LB-30]|uniref:AbiTii domain-containing protein n=1 Tax=Shiella aurantiaca TaxID=3058365 RepID=A0ABT8F2H1_9BACT|nr:hypothetical protein [Shiella aurantiaca]MDN4164554.1 hypothetical protein [Shiella aurantiaca]